jgi:chromosome segregation ATPase
MEGTTHSPLREIANQQPSTPSPASSTKSELRSRLEALEVTEQVLEHNLTSTTSLLIEMTTTAGASTQALQLSNQRVDALLSEGDAQEAAFAALQAGHAALLPRVNQLNHANVGLQDQLASLQELYVLFAGQCRQNEELLRRSDRVDAAYAALHAAHAELLRRFDALQAAHAASNAAHAASDVELRDRLKAQAVRVDRLEARLEAQAARVDRLEARCSCTIS